MKIRTGTSRGSALRPSIERRQGRNVIAPGRAYVIAIAGGSGSGKSWLADLIAKRLGCAAVRLSLDSFYRDRSALSLQARGKLNFDHPRAIDWEAFERALASLCRCKQTIIPVYDFATHTRKGETMLYPARVVILDGLWTLRRPRVRSMSDLAVFMDCPARLRLDRRMNRDTRARGRSAASVRRQFRSSVEPMHVKYVEPQRRWAARVVRPGESELAAREIVRRVRSDLDVV